jgi:hypothetical protein
MLSVLAQRIFFGARTVVSEKTGNLIEPAPYFWHFAKHIRVKHDRTAWSQLEIAPRGEQPDAAVDITIRAIPHRYQGKYAMEMARP